MRLRARGHLLVAEDGAGARASSRRARSGRSPPPGAASLTSHWGADRRPAGPRRSRDAARGGAGAATRAGASPGRRPRRRRPPPPSARLPFSSRAPRPRAAVRIVPGPTSTASSRSALRAPRRGIVVSPAVTASECASRARRCEAPTTTAQSPLRVVRRDPGTPPRESQSSSAPITRRPAATPSSERSCAQIGALSSRAASVRRSGSRSSATGPTPRASTRTSLEVSAHEILLLARRLRPSSAESRSVRPIFPFELVRVDTRSHRTESGSDYYAINPKGYVPVLELDDGSRLTEGAVIGQFIADRRPAAKLAPVPGTLERYRLQEWLNFIASEVHKSFGPLFSPQSRGRQGAFRGRIGKRFDYVAQELERQPASSSARPSRLPMVISSTCSSGPVDGIRPRAWPSLKAFEARVAERPARAGGTRRREPRRGAG